MPDNDLFALAQMPYEDISKWARFQAAVEVTAKKKLLNN